MIAMTYDHWKTTEPDVDDDAGPGTARLYDNGYQDGWKHGYESALHDAEQSIKALLRDYFDWDVPLDEALGAIRELAKAKP